MQVDVCRLSLTRALIQGDELETLGMGFEPTPSGGTLTCRVQVRASLVMSWQQTPGCRITC